MSENTLAVLPKLEIESPAANYRLATDVAGVCKEIVIKSAIDIHGKKYVRAEGWQAIATAHGCVASARDVEQIEGGIRAIGEVRRMADGIVICTAEGFVGDDETMWAKRPMYARRAMCQTRAISRACRSAFAHVVVLMDAGLSTTPAEEVQDGGFDEKPEHPAAQAKRPYQLKPATANEYPTSSAEPLADEDAPEWKDLVIHFGKNKGIRLGDLTPAQLRWYQNPDNKPMPDGWVSKPFKGRISEQDQALRNALDESMGKSPFVATDEEFESVPF